MAPPAPRPSAGADRVVELVPDEHGGVTVMVGGQPQSHVDLDAPEGLVFEYVQHLAAALDALLPASARPRPAITHVGGAGLSLPRWVHATRPGSPQVVLEPDTALTEIVRRELPLPRGHRIRVRPVGGAQGLPDLREGSADAVVVDAFAAGVVPPELVTTAFFAGCWRVLGPRGVLLMNCPDEPGWRHLGRVAASLRAAAGPDGADVALVAMRDVAKGRRYGNAVLVARRAGGAAEGALRGLTPEDLGELRRQIARWPFPSTVLDPAELERRTAGAAPFVDPDEVHPPAAPARGGWRVR